MKASVLVSALAFSDMASASNATKGNCYETAPSSKHYKLAAWKAEGKNFFDDMEFTTGPGMTSGAAYYLV